MQRLSTAVAIGLLALGSASARADQCETVKMADLEADMGFPFNQRWGLALLRVGIGNCAEQ